MMLWVVEVKMESSFSAEISVSEGSVNEELSLSRASLEEADSRHEDETPGHNGDGATDHCGDETHGSGKEPGIEANDTGDYEVMSEMIPGGRVSTWRVRKKGHSEDLAMKRLQLPDPSLRSERMCREFADSAGLWVSLGQHANIVRCYEMREISGEPAVFCEWMEGGSLQDRIGDGSLYEGDPLQVQLRIISIAMQAAEGLRFAHGRGIVHCDVRPSGIMFDSDGTVRVSDFDLAERIGKRSAGPNREKSAETNEETNGDTSEETNEESDVRRTAGFAPQYCAKEQLEGQPVKPWMDIYSWALTVLQMYTGERLWETGEEAAERFFDYGPQCRVKPPQGMWKLFAGCFKWKINDFSMVIKDLEKMPEEIETAASAASDDPAAFGGDSASAAFGGDGTASASDADAAAAASGLASGDGPELWPDDGAGDNDAGIGGETVPDGSAEQPQKKGLFGRLKKLFSTK